MFCVSGWQYCSHDNIDSLKSGRLEHCDWKYDEFGFVLWLPVTVPNSSEFDILWRPSASRPDSLSPGNDAHGSNVPTMWSSWHQFHMMWTDDKGSEDGGKVEGYTQDFSSKRLQFESHLQSSITSCFLNLTTWFISLHMGLLAFVFLQCILTFTLKFLIIVYIYFICFFKSY